MAMLLALDSSNSILSLVSNAWAGFGAAFGPLVLYSLYYKKLTHKAAVAGIITGAVTVLFWIYAPILSDGNTLSSIVYEIVPGFILSSVVIWLVSRINTAPNEDIITLFNKTNQIIAEQK
jgi:SSS family solute:Na+ symporter